MSIWFAIPVKPGFEQKAAALLQQPAQAAGMEEVFAPRALVERREHGMLVEQREPMIPGYVMAIAPSKWELRKCLRSARGMDYLYADGASFAEMRAEEVAFIERFTRPGARTAPVCEATVGEDALRFSRGPLQGLEHLVEGANVRTTCVQLETSVAGTPVVATVGLRLAPASASAQAPADQPADPAEERGLQPVA